MADAKAERGSQAARPLSPHLQIYKMPVNMLMSIVHRITGAALYFGTVLVACVLVAAASGPDAYATVTGLLGTWLGQLVLFGYTWALIVHMLGGVRHLIWDTGAYLEKHTATKLAIATLVLSIVLTVLVWAVIIWARMGA